jgi:Tol biopolymer transport system component
VGFSNNSDGSLKKISITGGVPVTLASAPNLYGASWSNNGQIVLEPTMNSGLQQIADSGGAMRPLTRLEQNEAAHRWPSLLPGDKAILFESDDTKGSREIVAYSLENGQRRNLVEGTAPQYAVTGHLVYSVASTLLAAPFDAVNLKITGPAVPMIHDVREDAGSGAVQYGISSTGHLVYLTGGVQSQRRTLVWVSRTGVEQALPAPPHAYTVPRISPDGRRIAVDIREASSDIWLYDIGRESLSRLTIDASATNPLWTPDGQRVVFQSVKAGRQGRAWQQVDGSGGAEKLASGEERFPSSFSPDGKLLAYYEVSLNTQRDVWVLNLGDPQRTSTPVLQTPVNEAPGKFSPDGHWMAYASGESGRSEVYIRAYPGPGSKWQISTEGGGEPTWNRNGRELFYRDQGKMMAVDITTQPAFAAGKPHMLFAGQYVAGTVVGNYDVTPDGQRFLMLKEGQEIAPPTQINVVLNWFEELKQKVPVANK